MSDPVVSRRFRNPRPSSFILNPSIHRPPQTDFNLTPTLEQHSVTFTVQQRPLQPHVIIRWSEALTVVPLTELRILGMRELMMVKPKLWLLQRWWSWGLGGVSARWRVTRWSWSVCRRLCTTSSLVSPVRSPDTGKRVTVRQVLRILAWYLTTGYRCWCPHFPSMEAFAFDRTL